MNLLTILKALPVVGPVAAAAPEFKALFDEAAAFLTDSDERTAKEAYDDLIADNAEGFARLDTKLAAAEGR